MEVPLFLFFFEFLFVLAKKKIHKRIFEPGTFHKKHPLGVQVLYPPGVQVVYPPDRPETPSNFAFFANR